MNGKKYQRKHVLIRLFNKHLKDGYDDKNNKHVYVPTNCLQIALGNSKAGQCNLLILPFLPCNSIIRMVTKNECSKQDCHEGRKTSNTSA